MLKYHAESLQLDENPGRLQIIHQNGDVDADMDFEQLSSYGARSF